MDVNISQDFAYEIISYLWTEHDEPDEKELVIVVLVRLGK